MNRKEFNRVIKNFKDNEERLKSLVIGQKIYEMELQDPLGGSYFEHEVTGIDLDEMCVLTKDLSQKGKESKLDSFYLGNEVNLPNF